MCGLFTGRLWVASRTADSLNFAAGAGRREARAGMGLGKYGGAMRLPVVVGRGRRVLGFWRGCARQQGAARISGSVRVALWGWPVGWPVGTLAGAGANGIPGDSFLWPGPPVLPVSSRCIFAVWVFLAKLWSVFLLCGMKVLEQPKVSVVLPIYRGLIRQR